MKTSGFLLSALLIFAATALVGCGLSSEVTFKEPDPLGGAVEVAPGLGVSNGGYFAQTTHAGNKASLSIGSTTNDLKGTTAQGNQYYLNVIGQQSQ